MIYAVYIQDPNSEELFTHVGRVSAYHEDPEREASIALKEAQEQLPTHKTLLAVEPLA